MSRHRNIRNLDYDDYYDDYYDDDYYDDDDYDDDYAYKKPISNKSKKTTTEKTSNNNNNNNNSKAKKGQATKKTPGSSASNAASNKKQPPSTTGQSKIHAAQNKNQNQIHKSNTVKDSMGGGISIDTLIGTKTRTTQNNKMSIKIGQDDINLVTNMGFSSTQAQDALKNSNGDVQNAIEYLLSGNNQMHSSADEIKVNNDISDKQGDFNPVIAQPNTSMAIQPQSQLPKKKDDASRKAIVSELTKGQRSRLSMIVLGHVDAGKSTLVGQLLVQLGHIEKRIVQKYQRQATEMGKGSFALAWIMDEDESERERGVTVEVGTKLAKTNNHDITILDAPGHRDFIPSMITGAASADVGLLVIAATPGEFEDGFATADKQKHSPTGQTREHIILARGLGVSQLIVTVNKLDAAQPSWSQDRFIEIRDTLTPFLQSTGFNMKRVRFVPVSGLNGTNMHKRNHHNNSGDSSAADELYKWYNGPTLIEAIDSFSPAVRNIEKPLRFITTDVYAEGRGVTVRGRVIQGFIRVGDKIVVLPIGDEATVNRMDNRTATSASNSPYEFSRKTVDDAKNSSNGTTNVSSSLRMKTAIAGDNTEIVLVGIDAARISTGCILCHLDDRVTIKRKFTAQIAVMENLGVPIIRGAQVLFHMHSLDVPAMISKLVSVKKADGTANSRPRVLTSGCNATVEINTSESLCIEEYSSCRSLGRFVLRRGGDTIAVGVIESLIK